MCDITNNSELVFDDFCIEEDGMIFWYASELCRMLGYSDVTDFKDVMKKVNKVFTSLNIEPYDNIIRVDRDGAVDYKLTRYACYLAAMNADPRHPEVAKVQAYFAQQTRAFELYIENSTDIERVIIRDDIKEGNKALASAAREAGVEDYAKFTNAGYRGMYNMMNYQLAKKRGCDKDKLFETMGRTELAANLFRITQTEARIKSQNIKGQEMLEHTHFKVGQSVREIIKDNMGTTPERLPQEKKIPDIKKALKTEFKGMKKIDSKKGK